MTPLNWWDSTFTKLAATDGRIVELRIRAMTPSGQDPCATPGCGHPRNSHLHGLPENSWGEAHRCWINGQATKCECRKFTWSPGLTEGSSVRFFAAVPLQSKGRAWSAQRHRYEARITTSWVRLHSMPFGSLVQLAHAGEELRLNPRRRYAHGAAVIPATEMQRLGVALDEAIEAGIWAPVGFSAAPSAQQLRLA